MEKDKTGKGNGIKRMKLYRHPERVYNEISAAGYGNDAPLKEEDIRLFDQYHYLGTDTVDDAIECLKVGPRSRLLEIGSGLGGPARYLAEKTGCHVTAVELQPDLNQIASSLTKRCDLSGRVEHLCGDILEFPESGGNFDGAVSWLAILHIPDRQALLKKCRNILKPGGKVFFEDYYKLGEFSPEEVRVLREDVQCPYLPTAEEYKKQLMENGFKDVELEDKTVCWSGFVNGRVEKFIENRNSYEKIHGAEVTEGMEDFYKKVLRLFRQGNLGGARITAVKV
ncbi:MAG: methyltransferase domain-containing protein [Candidatus Omnitrophica bacterium]|nr:methyltransferase domain-containing protein [Candidatus Omnitrophota bacterium]MDD5042332.1 methyltransferase domain-containing protein [Candidatus Omnitrophota bacterium]MDD5500443.1 methyltransferase domain-containing protein [Candidatus Omnitrophota bacterium]